MITQADKDLYKKLCIVFGAFQELIQGAGGNISIKSDSQIILKASGVSLSETTDSYGYVLCKKETLEVLEGEGKPSMESGFHCLPPRIIVHFHSLSCLTKFRMEEKDILYLPYTQPGDTLSNVLHKNYSHQPIVYLTNHGIILLGDTEEEIYDSMKRIFSEEFYTVFLQVKELYEFLSCCILETYTKKSKFSFFTSYTPDIFLFLRRAPFYIHTTEKIQTRLQEYIEKEKCLPAIIHINSFTFVVGSTWKKCLNIRDVYEGYCKLMENRPSSYLLESDCEDLLSCEKEAYRLR